MRQGQHNKRNRNRNARRPNGGGPQHHGGGGGGGGGGHNRNQTYHSNSPDGKRISGSAFTVYDKYIALAGDAEAAGDRIMAQSYYQHAEHYYRIVNELQQDRQQRDQRQGGGGQYRGGVYTAESYDEPEEPEIVGMMADDEYDGR